MKTQPWNGSTRQRGLKPVYGTAVTPAVRQIGYTQDVGFGALLYLVNKPHGEFHQLSLRKPRYLGDSGSHARSHKTHMQAHSIDDNCGEKLPAKWTPWPYSIQQSRKDSVQSLTGLPAPLPRKVTRQFS